MPVDASRCRQSGMSLLAVGLLAALALAAGCAKSGTRGGAPADARPAEPRCALDATPTEIPVEDPRPGERHVLYELRDRAEWREPDAEIAVAYRAGVAARLGDAIDPRSLLARQRPIYEALRSAGGPGDADNIATVLDHLDDRQRGISVAAASCLEALLWREADRRWSMLTHPTEFGAFVLAQDGALRVYLATVDFVGQKMRHEVTDRIRADVEAGWRLEVHLHNHPFLFDRKPGDRLWTNEGNVDDVGGALAPSMTDVQFWRSMRDDLGLRSGAITNGFDTARYGAAEFDRLVAAE